MYRAKHELLHLLALDRNPSSKQFLIDVLYKIITFAIPSLLHAPQETTKIHPESVHRGPDAPNGRRSQQIAQPICSPGQLFISNGRSPCSQKHLKSIHQTIHWRWGAPKRSSVRCRHWFHSIQTADKSNDAKISRTMRFLVTDTRAHTHTHTHPHTRARTHVHARTHVRAHGHTYTRPMTN